MSLHATHLHNREKTLVVLSDCSYSGRWADLAFEYMDKHKIQPCAHSAKAANTLLEVIPSSLASKVPRSMEFSVKRLNNSGFFYTNLEPLGVFNNTCISCNEGATIQDPCSLPPDYTWQKHCKGERIWRHTKIDQAGNDSHQWMLVLVVDDKETLRTFYAKRDAKEPFNTFEYGEVIASGPGLCPPKEVQERFIKEYPTIAGLKRALSECPKPGTCEHHS